MHVQITNTISAYVASGFSWGPAAPAASKPPTKETEADGVQAPRVPGLQADGVEENDDDDGAASTNGAEVLCTSNDVEL